MENIGRRTQGEIYRAGAFGRKPRARAVVLGRPWVYGLALDGAAGAAAVLRYVLSELDLPQG